MDNPSIKPQKTLARALNLPALSRDFKLICGYQLLLNLIDGMLGLFLPIFLFENFHQSIYLVIVFYLLGYGLYALSVPLGAMIMSKIGLKKSIIIARFIVIGFYAAIFLLKNNIWAVILISNVFLLLFRLLYWVPYHTNFAQITHRDSRGRSVAYVAIVGYVAGIAAPLLAGLILSGHGFGLLFSIAIAVMTLAIIPLFFIKPVNAHFDFSYIGTFKELFKKENKNLRIAYMADGAQSTVGIIIWPIFIYQLLERQYLAVGAVSTLIISGTIIFYLIAGQFTDKLDKKKIMKYGSLLYSVGWLLKTFVATAFQIFIVGTIHTFSEVFLRTPLAALMYEKAADHGAYVDEYTVLREISICLGRSMMCLLLIALIGLINLKIVFPIAAVISLLINFL